MTLHVNIGEAKTRLSELVAAAVRGEEVVLSKAGTPQVRLVAVTQATDAERARIASKRKAAIGLWREAFRGADTVVSKPMSDQEADERWRRKFGPAA